MSARTHLALMHSVQVGNAGMNESKPYAFGSVELESITQRSFHVAIALSDNLAPGGFRIDGDQ
jgi:hypothetical protein